MIEAQGLYMNYGAVKAVSDVSFLVNKGEVVGLLGPNGAGKTTIMKILATQIIPTKGTAKVDDKDIVDDPIGVRKSLGYLPEQAPLYDDMEVREYLQFVARARGLEGNRLKERLTWVAENCGLKKMWCRPNGQLSKGYRQRVGLAQALIHDPPVLILDEPTSGLDPLQIIQIRSLVKKLAKEKAVLFSTHILQEIQAVSDRILIINEGTIRADGTLGQLAAQTTDYEEVYLRIKDNGEDICSDIKGLDGVISVEEISSPIDERAYVIQGKRGANILENLSNYLKGVNLHVKEIYERRPDLERIFTALIER